MMDRRSRFITLAVGLAAGLAVAVTASACGQDRDAVPLDSPMPDARLAASAPTPQPTATLTPNPTEASARTPTPSSTATPEPTPAPTAMLTPSSTPTLEPAATPTTEPTATPIPTPTAEPTATPTPTPEPTATLMPTPGPHSELFQGARLPSHIKWEIGEAVTEEEVQVAIKAARMMHDYTMSLGLPETSGDITVHLYRDVDALRSACARLTSWSIEKCRGHWTSERPQGWGGSGWALVNMGTPWVQSDYPYHLFRIVAGELNNAQKYEWSELRLSSAGDVVPEAGPRWHSSGTTGFLVTLIGDNAGLRPYDERRQWLVDRTLRNPMEAPLSTMETQVGFEAAGRHPYSYSALAAELLASHAGVGSLWQYYANHQSRTPWQETFKNTFGMTIEEFYEMFEQHRAADFPKVDVPKFTER